MMIFKRRMMEKKMKHMKEWCPRLSVGGQMVIVEGWDASMVHKVGTVMGDKVEGNQEDLEASLVDKIKEYMTTCYH